MKLVFSVPALALFRWYYLSAFSETCPIESLPSSLPPIGLLQIKYDLVLHVNAITVSFTAFDFSNHVVRMSSPFYEGMPLRGSRMMQTSSSVQPSVEYFVYNTDEMQFELHDFFGLCLHSMGRLIDSAFSRRSRLGS